MKRLLVLAVLLAMMVCPVVALKTDFQSYVPFSTALPTTQGDWVFNGVGTTSPSFSNINSPDSYGRVTQYLHSDGNPSRYGTIYNIDATTFSYAAWTVTYVSSTNGGAHLERIILYDAVGNTLWTSPIYSVSLGRYDLVISGGTATLYLNGAYVTSGAGLVANPARIQLISDISGGLYQENIYTDDIILGTISDGTIIGIVPPDYYIYYDSVSPASTGLYKSNNPAAPTLINSNYFGVSYGRPLTGTATNLLLKNPSGNLVKSYPVNNQSWQGYLPIADLYVSGNIQNGRWSVELEDAPTSVNYFWVYADGAIVNWDAATYAPSDTANIAYSITAGRWDPLLYTYSMKIIDVFGNEISNQPITTQTGAKTYSWTTSDSLGVYYAEVIQTTISTSMDTILNYDTATLQGTFSFSGYVLDAESAAPLQGARVNFTQLGAPRVSLSAVNGAYNATGFVTGGATIINITKSGYVQYYNTVTPMQAKNIVLNLSLLSTNPTKVGATIGGIARDGTYGSPITGATVTAINGTTYTGTTNNAGYYSFSNLINGTCYRIQGSKTGYANSVSYLKCAGGLL